MGVLMNRWKYPLCTHYKMLTYFVNKSMILIYFNFLMLKYSYYKNKLKTMKVEDVTSK